jgi:hypothetical protein
MEDVFVRKLPLVGLAGLAAAAIAGTAGAASRNSHVMTVSLPDGSAARVEYVGDVPPKITFEAPGPMAPGFWPAIPSFAGFDRLFEQMSRQTDALMREAQHAAQQPSSASGLPIFAGLGTAPAGVSSTTIVSYTNGASTCTRTTQTLSQGPGKPPKVSSTLSGNCGAGAPPPAAPPLLGLSHT